MDVIFEVMPGVLPFICDFLNNDGIRLTVTGVEAPDAAGKGLHTPESISKMISQPVTSVCTDNCRS